MTVSEFEAIDLEVTLVSEAVPEFLFYREGAKEILAVGSLSESEKNAGVYIYELAWPLEISCGPGWVEKTQE